jgi:protein-tyrosine phosphatase
MFERYVTVGTNLTKRAYQRLCETRDAFPGRETHEPGALASRLGPEPRVCFLCYGNICRSPFAERYYRNRVDPTERSVTSAGFYAEEGRSSPTPAVETARKFDVDLAPHRSRRVRQADIEESDVVFAMDYRNLFDIGRRLDSHDTPVVLLGELDDAGRTSIPDPYGKCTEAFETTYRRIAGAVDKFVDELED